MSVHISPFKHRRLPKLRDHTKKFVELLKNLQNLPSIVILNIGGRGSGKTGNMFKVITIATKYNKEMVIVFFNAPKSFIELLKTKKTPFRNRLFNIRNINDLDVILKKYKYVILCVDEGLLNLNAKQALTIEHRDFEKFSAISRHKNVSIIINTQIKNVTKSVREMADIVFYKGNTINSINESDNKFVKKYKKKIQNLYLPVQKKKSIFESTYSHFIEKSGDKDKLITKGYISLDLFDVCPFWDDTISKLYEKQSVVSDMDDYNAKSKLITSLATIFMREFSLVSKKDISAPALRGWLRNKYSKMYFKMKKDIPLIYDEISVRLLERKNRELSGEDDYNDEVTPEEEKIIESIDPISTIDLTFASYVDRKITDKRLREIYHLFLEGTPQRDMADKLKMNIQQINTILKKFREEKIGYYFEQYIALLLNVEHTAENSNQPDIIDDKNQIYYTENEYGVFTLKCYHDRSKSITFYQSKDFRPEYEYVKAHGLKEYYFLFINLGWSPYVCMLVVNPNGDDKVLIKKDKNEDDRKRFDFFLYQRKKLKESMQELSVVNDNAKKAVN